MPLERTRCANHPDRYGHALCMTCRKTVCQECATEWDGVYHCTRCLAQRRDRSREGSAVGAWILLLLASAMLFFAAPPLLTWGATLWVRSFAS